MLSLMNVYGLSHGRKTIFEMDIFFIVVSAIVVATWNFLDTVTYHLVESCSVPPTAE